MLSQTKFKDCYYKGQEMRESVRNGEVALLRASVLAQLLSEKKLTALNRQTLEARYPEAFADEELVSRCFREADAAARTRHCAYPGLLAVSYCWKTARHPDPDGTLGTKLAKHFHWYAAQRARWTKERLYDENEVWQNEEYRIKNQTFHWDFVVFVDFWSLFQHPRTDLQSESFNRALGTMHRWYGHAGAMVFAETSVPESWKRHPEFKKRGGYKARGWTEFERNVASLCHIAGMLLDLGGFDEMLSASKTASPELQPYGSRALALTGQLLNATEQDLRTLAMHDRLPSDQLGTTVRDSCLYKLVVGKHLPPLPPDEMEEELKLKEFSNVKDVGACAAMYRAVATEVLGRQESLEYRAMLHWSPSNCRSVGRALRLCDSLKQLSLKDAEMGEHKMRAFISGLDEGCARQLETVHFDGNQLSEQVLFDLGEALKRGAMPSLRQLSGIQHESLAEGWHHRLAASLGMPVEIDGRTMTICRTASEPFLSARASHAGEAAVRRADSLPTPPLPR